MEALLAGVGWLRVRSLKAPRPAPRKAPSPSLPEGALLLLLLWRRKALEAEALARLLFPGSKNPKKRLQVAVHHLREALDPDLVRLEGRPTGPTSPRGLVGRPRQGKPSPLGPAP